jgi:phosphohistidine phosphatase SixA
MPAWLLVGVMALSLIAPASVTAQGTAATPLRGAELLAALRAGGLVLYFRHADTDHRQNDSRMTSVEDCANQRNLTDRGRDNAREIGAGIRAAGIPIGTVLASPMCRTMETATLAFGAAEKAPAVREGGAAPPGTAERYPALRARLAAPVAPGANTVIVGHAYPYYSLVGGQYLSEGEADVLRPNGAGFEFVARLGVGRWRDLAGAPASR